MFYAFIQDNKIIGKGQCQCLNSNILNTEITEEVYNNIELYIYDGSNVIINANYEQEQQEKEEQEFNRRFFNTSLGYISRDVHMKNGKIKDFLTDILPLLKEGIPVITYTRQLEQSNVPATAQFIKECEQQLMTDFYGEVQS